MSQDQQHDQQERKTQTLAGEDKTATPVPASSLSQTTSLGITAATVKQPEISTAIKHEKPAPSTPGGHHELDQDEAVRRAAATLHAVLQSPGGSRRYDNDLSDTQRAKLVPQAQAPVPRSSKALDVKFWIEATDDYLANFPGNLTLAINACGSQESLRSTIATLRKQLPADQQLTWQSVRTHIAQRFCPPQDPMALVQAAIAIRQDNRSLADYLAAFEHAASEVDTAHWPDSMRITSFLNNLSNTALANTLKVDKQTNRSDWAVFVTQLLDTAHRLQGPAAQAQARTHKPGGGQVHAIQPADPATVPQDGAAQLAAAPDPAIAALVAHIQRLEGKVEALGQREQVQQVPQAEAHQSPPRCFNCHRIGHIARFCRAPRAPRHDSNRPNGQGGARDKPPDPAQQ